MPRRIALIAIAVVLLATAADAQFEERFLSFFGRTFRTRLPRPKNPVGPFVNPGVTRVVLIVLENGDPAEAAKQPFLMERASEGMLFSHYYAVAHPSQPNYIAMISGSTRGTRGDFTRTLHRDHLGNHVRWKAYAEDYPARNDPAVCNRVRSDGAYVERHVPFLSFDDIDCRNVVRLNADATARVVSSAPVKERDLISVTKALRDDIANGTLPSFVMIVPNLQDDGHAPSTLRNANDWLTRYIEPLLSDPALTKNTVFVLTFDEDEHTLTRRPNRVYTVMWGDRVRHGVDDDVYDHEDLFLTIAALLKVFPLPPTDESDSRPISGIWK